MGDATDDEPTPPSSSAPPSPVHCTMTIGEICAHFMEMVWEEQFREAQADAGYNLQLLEEHQQAEEQLDDGRPIASDADVVEHATLLESYRSAREIRLDRWWYRQHQAELEAAYKQFDEAANKVWGKSDDEEDITGSTKAAPRRHDHEAGTSAGAAGNKEE